MHLPMIAAEAATNTAATGITSRIITFVWDNSAAHACYLISFEDYYESLMNEMDTLRSRKIDVMNRIEVGELTDRFTRLAVVDDWLRKVEGIETEVSSLLHESSREINQRCFGDCCPNNWLRRYSLGKKVCKQLKTVQQLLSGSNNFEVVASISIPGPAELRHEDRNVGIDEAFSKVLSWVADDKVKIIGIWGMGGVGKTTLLKKINNAFVKKEDDQIGLAVTFDLVIWIVVSSNFSIQKIQEDIRESLGFKWTDIDNNQYKRAQHILNVLSKKKFILFFDDVWEHLDLETIGIPSPHTSSNNSKLVFTTRSEEVCGDMQFSIKYKVPVLEWEPAWELFQQNVGEDTLTRDREILKLAKEVAEECGGLPLALITTGRAMSTSKTLPEWKHALAVLKQYASQFKGMENKVLSILKLSYDHLDNTARDCFLYCSLYPEDYNIEIDEIVDQWIGEGFLNKFEKYDMIKGQGHDVIATLRSACLLEMGSFGESQVKLHDIVRELALWIARECGKTKNKYLVQAGVGLSQAPEIECWKDAERISLMNNDDLKELNGAPECAQLTTLMLRLNRQLSVIPDDFFHYMPNLKVLDFSHATGIKYLPKSIGCLLELQYLNLRNTGIETLPKELRNLEKLKYLNLWETVFLDRIPPGTISCFPRLQVLYLYNLYMDGLIEAELETLQQLGRLDLYIKKFLIHQNMLLSQRLQSCLEILELQYCYELTELALMSSLHLGKTKRLRQLQIYQCSNLEKLTINNLEANKDDMGSLSTLEYLRLQRVPKCNILWAERATHLHFKLLTKVYISDCNALKDISWLVLAPFLRFLTVFDCSELKEIILDRFAAVTIEDQNALSRLVEIRLSNLPKLKSIVKTSFSFPSLLSIRVYKCPLLKKLPFASNNIHNSKLLEIKGNVKWWEELEWEDQTIKTSLQPIFQARNMELLF